MPRDELREHWEVIAHMINNATANIMLETSTLKILLKKLEGPKDPVLQILKSLDLSVEVISAALQEMEELWHKMDKSEPVELKVWEEDFRRRLVQIKEKGIQDNTLR